MQKKSHILFFLIICLVTQTAFCKTITVSKSKNISSIHKALFIAADGDTILVNPGIYKEGNITINKAIVLKGINGPVLDGENIRRKVVAIVTPFL